MNENSLQQIFRNYIDHFEELNGGKKNGPTEWYKWRIASNFKSAMDSALESDDKKFWEKLYEIKKETEDFIDNYTQPLYGLVQFSKKEPQTVKTMFRELYADDSGNLDIRVKKIQTFLEKSHQLKEKYTPNSFLYEHDFRSVTAYLFLYDPDHNYVYKPTASNKFAGYIEFNNDFGSGACVKLKNYYHMCDQIAASLSKREKEIKDITDLRTKMANRKLYADPAHHILVYDIIYCAYIYNLFDGVSFKPRSQKEWKILEEKQEKAKELLEKLESERKRQEQWDEAMEYVDSALYIGAEVWNKAHGKGKIIQKNENTIIVAFEDQQEMKFGIWEGVAGGYVTSENEDTAAHLTEIKMLLGEKNNIENAVSKAEKDLAPYSAYI